MIRKITLLLVCLLLSSSFFAQSKKEIYGIQMQKLLTSYRMINSLYVDDVDAEMVVEDAIIAMLKDLDPHSAYASPEEVKKMNEPLKGNFDGIGIQFNVLDDSLIVVSPIPGGPSEKVGIQAGDRIVKVDTTTIAGVKCSRTKMVELLRGEKGTKVKVIVKRKGIRALLPFTITRDKIPIFSLDAAYMVNSKTGYIKLSRFSATTHREFMEAVATLKKQGLENLIIDLQGNGGGYMQPAIEIADQFLEKDRLIVYTEGRNSPKQPFNSKGGSAFEEGGLIVLVDEASASASEIFSGAMQDWDRGLVVGRRSYGKGLVQRPLGLNDGAEIRLTIARYHTPSGRCIQKPYVEGEKKEYSRDLMKRFESGELVNADSIDFPDSLIYKTLVEGRTVYGGGGIIPDVFVPLDTTSYSEFHRQVIASGVLNEFMLTYMDNNREQLEGDYPHFEKFNAKFEISEDLFQEMVTKAAEDSIIYDEEEFAISHDYLFLQMKAIVARDLFDTSEYFQVINTRNKSFLKAVEIMTQKKKQLAEYSIH